MNGSMKVKFLALKGSVAGNGVSSKRRHAAPPLASRTIFTSRGIV
jgi:hypothetical protein